MAYTAQTMGASEYSGVFRERDELLSADCTLYS